MPEKHKNGAKVQAAGPQRAKPSDGLVSDIFLSAKATTLHVDCSFWYGMFTGAPGVVYFAQAVLTLFLLENVFFHTYSK